MECTLVGVSRLKFNNNSGDTVKCGYLYVTTDFDEGQEDCAGIQCAKVNFDYDEIPALTDLQFPARVELQINLKGKCTKVILTSDKPGKG